MGIRKSTGRALRSVIGADRTAKLRNAERRARRKLALRLDPKLTEPTLKRRFSISGGTKEYVQPDAYADFPKPPTNHYGILKGLHEVSRPKTYLEIGLRTGKSLALSRSRTIGIDPQFAIEAEVQCDIELHRTTSDEYFARPDACAFFDGVDLEMAFIDGMHLSEYALRDFINVEKHMSPAGIVVLDDMLPRNEQEAARDRVTAHWAGDVYKLLDFLEKYRPDLTIIPVNTRPTGTALVLGLDPTSTVLEDVYDDVLATCLSGDPQQVDNKWMTRSTAVDPNVLLASPAWNDLIALRGKSVDREALTKVLAELSALPKAAAV